MNLFWALDRMWQTAEAHAGESIPAIRETLFAEAQRIRDEDVAISRSIGELGFGLLHHGDGILTLQRRNARHREIRHGDRADVYRA